MTDEREGLTSRERVVSAATALFVRDGYRATSMKAIASHLGMSTPALYWHFSSKRELYLASIENVLDNFVDYVAVRVRSSDPVDRLREFVGAHVMWRLAERAAAGAFTTAVGSRDVLHAFPAPHRESLATKQRAHLDRLGEILTAGRVAGAFRDDSRVTAFAIITMCDYVSSWYAPSGKLEPHQIADLYCNAILQMLDADTSR